MTASTDALQERTYRFGPLDRRGQSDGHGKPVGQEDTQAEDPRAEGEALCAAHPE